MQRTGCTGIQKSMCKLLSFITGDQLLHHALRPDTLSDDFVYVQILHPRIFFMVKNPPKIEFLVTLCISCSRYLEMPQKDMCMYIPHTF